MVNMDGPLIGWSPTFTESALACPRHGTFCGDLWRAGGSCICRRRPEPHLANEKSVLIKLATAVSEHNGTAFRQLISCYINLAGLDVLKGLASAKKEEEG